MRSDQLIAQLTQLLESATGEHGEPHQVLSDDAVRLAQELAAVADWAAAEPRSRSLRLLPALTDHSLDPKDRQHNLRQRQDLAAGER